MGWWSATVLGGDTPLDWLGNLADVMGVSYKEDKVSENSEGAGYYGYNYNRELVDEHMGAMVHEIEASRWDQDIGFQVLGAIALQCGATIPTELKHKMVKAAAEDSWAKDSGERKAYMKDLIDKVLAHSPGTETELTVEGLI